MTNRLASEKSPYLQQHAENPVDWYPWGEEALERARREDRPILVSIGYSACHWCHVMAHESFEDPRTADLMNRHFVNIKVDREERPDVDAIYMEAVQALTGQGGWPLNVFLTPDARPFFGGTYFPPQRRHGLPSWTEVLQGVAETYRTRRGDVVHNAEVVTRFIAEAQHQGGVQSDPGPESLQTAYENVRRQFDMRNGGFGGAPKFPQPLGLEFVLRMVRRLHDQEGRRFLDLTLSRMAAGGMYDQLGGGFHRYSVDAVWLVPHFEKMLYDNALLARLYTYAYSATGHERYGQVAEETLDYLLRDLRSPEGAFYSAQDADSEGVEGKYYVWTPSELEAALGPEPAEVAARRYGVTASGNFEGATILTLASSTEGIARELGITEAEAIQAMEAARTRLLAARARRTAPGTDTKILAGWNGLAICALAEAGAALRRPDYLDVALRAMDFVLTRMRVGGRLVRSFQDGPSDTHGFLEDYAACTEACLALYEAALDVRYLDEATRLADEMIRSFWDGETGGFFDTSAEATSLVVRPRSLFDNPIPSGNSSACMALLRLHAVTGDDVYLDRAETIFRAGGELLARAPLGVPYLLCALDFHLAGAIQVAIVGDPAGADTRSLIEVVHGRYLPNAVLAVGTGDSPALLAGRDPIGGRATAFVCEHFACNLPVTEPEELAAQLDAAT
jgi:uncharacterized protein YyaL (SSP411 family)